MPLLGTTVLTLNLWSQLSPLPDRHLQSRVFTQVNEGLLVGISSFPNCQFPLRDPSLLTESAGMVLPVSLSSVSSYSWLLKLLPSHTGVLAGSFLTQGVCSLYAKGNLQRLPKLNRKIKALFFKNINIQDFSPKDLKAKKAAVRVRSSRSQMNQLSVLWSAWHHSHSACNKSELQRAPCSSSVTSTKLPPPQISCNLQAWGLAAENTLAETVHTNLKTHPVTEILLTQEAWARPEQLLHRARDWKIAY